MLLIVGLVVTSRAMFFVTREMCAEICPGAQVWKSYFCRSATRQLARDRLTRKPRKCKPYKLCAAPFCLKYPSLSTIPGAMTFFRCIRCQPGSMLLQHPISSYISVVLPQRCLPWSSLASARRINSKAQDQQTSSMFDDYKGIDASISGKFSTKRNLYWGFSIYRCSYKNESAWSRLLQRLREHIESDLKCNQRMDLLSRHQLVINDDIEKFDGATSHDIRDHFNTWVTDQLPKIVTSPEVLEALHADDNIGWGPQYFLGPRYNFCLFVDDYCLDSLELFDNSPSGPIVKCLSKPWGNLTLQERNYKIHPEWHDGETDDELEMVGWIYLPVCSYVGWYDTLVEPSNFEEYYLRPPMMNDECSIVNVEEERLALLRRKS